MYGKTLEVDDEDDHGQGDGRSPHGIADEDGDESVGVVLE